MYMPLKYQHANMVLAEHPVGDPFAGAAFGEAHKSKGLGMVIGVVAGLATAGAGWGMMAAGQGLTLGSLAGGAMFAGSISTALGAVTGNKKLSKIGGILSLAGGVGSLAADGLAMAAGTEGARLGGTAAAGWSKTMSQLEGAFGSVMGQGTSAATISQGGVSGTAGLPAGAQQGSGILGSAMEPATFAAQSGAGPVDFASTSLSTMNPNSAITIGGAGVASPAATTTLGANAAAGAAAPAAGSSGILGKVMDFAQTPAGMNLAGNMVQGMAAGDAAQQELDLLKQKYGDNRADLERELANINFQYEIIDPNDPQAAQKQQAAKQRGVPTITLGVNQNAAPVQPMGITMQPNQMKVA